MTIEVAAKWTGEEQANFQKVLDAFEEKTGAKVTYASTGEDTGAYLGPRIQGGNPPDVAILPQPGLVAQYAEQNALKPLPRTCWRRSTRTTRRTGRSSAPPTARCTACW